MYGTPATIRTIWQPPKRMTLAELVSGFPLRLATPVVRRALAQREEIWDLSYVRTGAEKDL